MQALWAAWGQLWHLISRLLPQVEQDHSLNMQKGNFNSKLTSNIFFRKNSPSMSLSLITVFNVTLPFHFFFPCFSSFSSIPDSSSFSASFSFFLFFTEHCFWAEEEDTGDISENKNQFFLKTIRKKCLSFAVFPDNADWITSAHLSELALRGFWVCLGLASRQHYPSSWTMIQDRF